MADKIIVTSDGTVAGTTVKVDGKDYTKDYKVTSLSLYANGGYEYVSSYSGSKIVVGPRVSYSVDYIDGDKQKSITLGNVSKDMTYGSISKTSDSLSFIGIEDKDTFKNKLVDALDKLREKVSTIPTKDILEKRTVDSLNDKYVDLINELETIAKKEKETTK